MTETFKHYFFYQLMPIIFLKENTHMSLIGLIFISLSTIIKVIAISSQRTLVVNDYQNNN